MTVGLRAIRGLETCSCIGFVHVLVHNVEKNAHLMLDYHLHVMTVTILPSSNVFPARISIVDHGRSTTHDYLYPTVNAPPCSFMNLWDSCSYNLINQVHVDVVCMCEIHVCTCTYVSESR